MAKIVFNLLRIVCFYIATYVLGVWCLLKQMLYRHKRLEGIPLQTGKIAIVTGGASGIGFHVSKGLVSKNIHVVIAGKSKEDGHNAIKRIRADYPNAKVDFMQLDLASLWSVESFAEQFITWGLDLHILVNNAGVMFAPYQLTADGFETHFQVNFLSHFYLSQLLMNKLRRSGKENYWARVVNVSSAVHTLGSPDLDTFGKKIDQWYEYSSHKAYADSKMLVVAGAYKLHSVCHQDGMSVSVCAVHPGVVASGLWKYLYAIHRIPQQIIGPWLFWTPVQGSDTVLYAALSQDIEGQGGCYYENSQNIKSLSYTYEEEFQDKLILQCDLLIKKAKKTLDE